MRARVIVIGLLAALAIGCQTGNPFQRTDPPLVELGDPLAPPPASSDSTYLPPPDAPAGPAPVPPSGLSISTQQRFPDIPLPVGAKEDLERTVVIETSGFATGRMVYTTKSSVNELAQFFIEECPAADWKLENLVQADGAEMVFRKPGKRLTIRILDMGITRGRTFIITLMPETE